MPARRAILLVLAASGCAGAPPSRDPRLDPELAAALERLAPGAPVALLVQLAGLEVGAGASDDRVGSARLSAETALGPLRSHLQARGLWLQAGRPAPRLLWAAGALALSVPREAVASLLDAPGVAGLRLDAATTLPPRPPLAVSAATGDHLAAVHAPELWAAGIVGAGAVVAVLDTGVDAAHPDLAGRFRGRASDWHDPYGQQAAPADKDGHGTQVAGLVLGGDASGAAIGVAPGARWIAARVYDDAGQATLSGVHAALQWAADPDGDPATHDRPDAVVLAFTYPTVRNTCWREFAADIALLQAAGVAVIAAAGNDGPATTEPPANNPGSLPVGSATAAGAPSAFNSTGPSACQAGPYPALLAPAESVTSSDLTLGGLSTHPWRVVTGTSFAAPQVAGAVALLRQAEPAASTADILVALQVGAASAPGGAGLLDLTGARTALQALQALPSALDDAWGVAAGAILTVPAPGVLANDEGAALSASLLVPPRFGALSLRADGAFSYSPYPLFSGDDAFTYLAVGAGGASPATVTLHVGAPR